MSFGPHQHCVSLSFRSGRPPSRNDRNDGIVDAARTLRRATAFLEAGLRTPGDAPLTGRAISGEHAARVTGNGLREIDRFFGLLLDAVGQSLDAGGNLARLSNNANKIGQVLLMLGGEADYARHLRSIARVRNCLAHTGGSVRSGDARGASLLTLSWLYPAADSNMAIRERRLRLGEALRLTPGELSEICWFYDHMTSDLLERVARMPERKTPADRSAGALCKAVVVTYAE